VFEDFHNLGGVQVETIPQFPHLAFRESAPFGDGLDLIERPEVLSGVGVVLETVGFKD